MTKELRHTVLIVLTATAALAPMSCRTMRKATGTQEAFFQASPDRVVAAMEKAMKALDLTVIRAVHSKIDGKVVGRTAQDKQITIRIEREGDEMSRVAIKVGYIGDKAIGHAIIAETKKRLKYPGLK